MNGLDKQAKAAWVIVLTSTNRYVLGVLTIQHALRRLQSQYPLLILHTPAVSSQALELLAQAGCILRAIDLIRPKTATTYFTQRFTETWTKFAVWNQDDYDRLVLLDADMLPYQAMDELMTMSLPGSDWVAAVHACTCNPQKIAAYPSSWVPANCAYTGCGQEAAEQAPSTSKRDYFNSGLIVLSPSQSLFEDMVDKLHHLDDLAKYPFPDQDFLNEVFAHRWQPLPYTYNALKTLPLCHAPMWNMSSVKNIHYILAKPWDCEDDKDDPYAAIYRPWRDAFQQAAGHLDLSCIP